RHLRRPGRRLSETPLPYLFGTLRMSRRRVRKNRVLKLRRIRQQPTRFLRTQLNAWSHDGVRKIAQAPLLTATPEQAILHILRSRARYTSDTLYFAASARCACSR